MITIRRRLTLVLAMSAVCVSSALHGAVVAAPGKTGGASFSPAIVSAWTSSVTGLFASPTPDLAALNPLLSSLKGANLGDPELRAALSPLYAAVQSQVRTLQANAAAARAVLPDPTLAAKYVAAEVLRDFQLPETRSPMADLSHAYHKALPLAEQAKIRAGLARLRLESIARSLEMSGLSPEGAAAPAVGAAPGSLAAVSGLTPSWRPRDAAPGMRFQRWGHEYIITPGRFSPEEILLAIARVSSIESAPSAGRRLKTQARSEAGKIFFDAAAFERGRGPADAFLKRVSAVLEAQPYRFRSAAPAPVAAFGTRAADRKNPLVRRVSFAAAVPAERKAIFLESLTRRKTAWIEGLKAAGIKVERPIEPLLRVLKAEDGISYGGRPSEWTAYTVEWSQGPTQRGAFRATVRLDDKTPSLHRLPAPPAPASAEILVRFKSSFADEASRLEFLEKQSLRLIEIQKIHNGSTYISVYKTAVTGGATAAGAARRLADQAPVFSATAPQAFRPKNSQLWLQIKKASSEDDIAAFLAASGLVILEVGEHNIFRVGPRRRGAGSRVAKRLEGQGPVLFASPVATKVGEKRQAVITLRETATEDEIARLFHEMRLRVIRPLDARVFRVASWDPVPGETLAARLTPQPAVYSAVAIGSPTEDMIKAAAAGTAMYKGEPWPANDYYSAVSGARTGLERQGASLAQLEQFDRLCSAHPVRGGGFSKHTGT